MSKPSGNQVTTTKIDPAQEARNKEVADRFRGVSNQEYSPTTPGADQGAQTAAGLAQSGMSALGGDQEAFGRFFNPYQQNVMDALGSQYDRMRSQASLGANDAATQAGAFGGDRHALMVGERQGELDRGQMSDTAKLLYGGYNDAMGRAGQAVNLGMGAGGYYSDILKEKRDWDLRNAQVLQSGLTGLPYGQSTSTPQSKNVAGSALGGAATGAAIGSAVPGIGTAIGAGVGGGIGLFGSLF